MIISDPSEPRERTARVGVDHPEEGERKEADEEDQGDEDGVGDALPWQQVVRLREVFRRVPEEDTLHRVQVIRGRDDDRDEWDVDDASGHVGIRRTLRVDDNY